MVRLAIAAAVGALAVACGGAENPAGSAGQQGTGAFGEACTSPLWNLPDGGGPCAPMLAQCADAGPGCAVVAACAATGGELDDGGNFAGPTVCTVHCGETPDGPALCAALGGECVTATPGASPTWCRRP